MGISWHNWTYIPEIEPQKSSGIDFWTYILALIPGLYPEQVCILKMYRQGDLRNMTVFVLLFNAGTDNEGIHTLKLGDRNIVLMFEDEDDATRYGLMLEAQDFPTPTPEEFDAEEIESFCRDANYECKFVPSGSLEIPPESNIDSPDWNPDTKSTDALSQSGATDQQASSTEPAEFSKEELDRLRRRFEGLL